MKFTLDLEGLEPYLTSLQRAGADVDDFAREAVEVGVQILGEELSARVPVGETGDLKNQLYRTAVFRSGNAFYAYAGLNLGEKKRNFRSYIYGLVLEFGSARLAARPWFRPGVSAAKRKILRRWQAMYEARYGR